MAKMWKANQDNESDSIETSSDESEEDSPSFSQPRSDEQPGSSASFL